MNHFLYGLLFPYNNSFDKVIGNINNTYFSQVCCYSFKCVVIENDKITLFNDNEESPTRSFDTWNTWGAIIYRHYSLRIEACSVLIWGRRITDQKKVLSLLKITRNSRTPIKWLTFNREMHMSPCSTKDIFLSRSVITLLHRY